MYDHERCNYQTIKVSLKQTDCLSSRCSSSSFRGFGFITFKEANSVDQVLAKDVHMLDEKQVG